MPVVVADGADVREVEAEFAEETVEGRYVARLVFGFEPVEEVSQVGMIEDGQTRELFGAQGVEVGERRHAEVGLRVRVDHENLWPALRR